MLPEQSWPEQDHIMNNNHPAHPPVTHDDGTITVPASMIQRQFWLIHQMQKDASAYNIASLFMLKGPLNTTALKESINEIVQHHQILRTNFTISEGDLVQRIHAERNIAFRVEDISSVKSSQQEAELMTLLEHEVIRPFDLEESPLLRFLLVKLEDRKHALSIVMHHIITDLQSKRLIGAELSARYNAKTGGPPFQMHETVHQYADFSRRQING